MRRDYPGKKWILKMLFESYLVEEELRYVRVLQSIL